MVSIGDLQVCVSRKSNYLHSKKRKKKFFFDCNIMFWFLPIDSGSDIEHHRENCGSIVFTPSLQTFIHIEENLWDLSFQGWTVPAISASLCWQTLLFLQDLLGLCWTHSSMSTLLFYWGSQHWRLHSRSASLVLWFYRGRITFLVLLATHSLKQPALLQGHLAASHLMWCPQPKAGLQMDFVPLIPTLWDQLFN